MKKLPFLVSIPHGGTKMPVELSHHTIISAEDLFDDSDAYTAEIYNVEHMVETQISTDYARAFIDLSRSEKKMPPKYKDGLIKSVTCYNRPIYASIPTPKMQNLLIQKYYNPYHWRLAHELENKKIMLALDCHSMAAIAPDIAPDKGTERPLINLGDLDGRACDSAITTLLQSAFVDVFQFKQSDVTINAPFKGGYITQKYGNNPKPLIQIEMNRNLYLAKQWFDRKTLSIDFHRLYELNQMFIAVLELFGKYYIEKYVAHMAV